ncbi:MAG: glycosyltransferase [Rudaea sp.]
MTQAHRSISHLQRAGFLLRFVPLFASMQLADWLAPRLPIRWPRREHPLEHSPGISIVVPERGTPDLLAATLSALSAACAAIDEVCQVIVVVNGADEADYAHLRDRHAGFEWQFHRAPLGYNGAICAGLAQARHDWTYLLNSDMRLDLRALAELLPYRQAQVFAVTSQIFFEDPTRRREETGWSDFVPDTDPPVVYEREPEPGSLARGNHYAGGGSSLFQTAALRRFAHASQVYNPFYWEDADWGLRAWNEGMAVLFCPTSHAWHQHRGTINRYYSNEEVERVLLRNAQWFDMRHARSRVAPIEHIRRIAARAPAHWDEFAGVVNAWNTFRLRMRARRAQRSGMPYADVVTRSFFSPRRPTRPDKRPRVLLVSPFGVFPPSHGGARRVAELVSRLADRVDFILLSDEASLYSIASEPWLRLVRATHLVEGRGDRPGESPRPLGERMLRHAWPGLRQNVERLIALYDPHIVQVEFMELALLADQRNGRGPRWLLGLHDVYLNGVANDDAEQRIAIGRYDAVSACSQEDLDLLDHANKVLIENGATDRRAAYEPSPQAPRLLFMGPFRYAQNQAGILEFLDAAWPRLKQRFPDLRLTILGGVESAPVVAADPRLRQPGVETVCAFVDPQPYLRTCTLTINPQTAIRGSSIKLIESLLAGRICVSTRDGARGFGDGELRDLVVAQDVAAMANRIAVLLADPQRRHALERPDDAKLDAHTWDAIADRQFDLYRRLAGTL